MKCPKCNFDNPSNVKFCGECGNKLEQKCSNCGFSNPPQFKFCGECGQLLTNKKSEQSPVIDFANPISYIPQNLADRILSDRHSLEGERKYVTVFFADVVGYTTISEKLDPEVLSNILDGWINIMVECIHRFDGTITQYMGDGIMALFGAPVSLEEHAQQACRAALAVQEKTSHYAKNIKDIHRINFQIRIGLNSGLVIVRSIGDDLKMNYTAIGDTVNLGSRMESSAVSDTILVSEKTYNLTQKYFEFEPIGKIQIKGKTEPQEAFRLLGNSSVVTRLEASEARGLTRFIGRNENKEMLLSCFDKAASGSGQVVSLVGEAGVGKSRLMLEFKKILSTGKNFSWLEGRCLHFGNSMQYLPILDILKSYFNIKENDSESVIKQNLKEIILALDEKLVSSIPALEELLSLQVEDVKYKTLEPKDKKRELQEAITNLLIQASQSKPLVIIVEDLHWIDKTSEELLGFLIESLPNTHILLVLLYRPEFIHQWGSKTYYSKIGLDQLDTKLSAELVHAVLEGTEVVPELEELILARSAGNPLFMEELIHALVDNNLIKKENNRFVLSQNPVKIQIPDSIQGIISARLDRLEDNLKRTMQVASVIGRDFAFRILQIISGMQADIKSHLRNLQGLEFIYEKRLFPELEFVFKHSLIQEVAYDSLLIKRREELHEKIGRAIEEIYSDKLNDFYAILAHHFSCSGNIKRACHYHYLAGERAADSFALQEANIHLSRVWELLKHTDNESGLQFDKLKVGILLAKILEPLGKFKKALEILQETWSASNDTSAPELKAKIQFLLGNITGNLGQYESAKKFLNQSLELAKLCDDSETKGDIFNYLGQITSIQSDLTLSNTYFEKANQYMRAIGNPHKLAWTLTTSLMAVGYIKTVDEINLAIEDAERWVEQSGNKRVRCMFLGMKANCYLSLGHYEEVLEIAVAGITLAGQIGEKIQTIVQSAFAGLAALRCGKSVLAGEILKKGELEGEKTNHPFGLALIKHAQANLLLSIGDINEALVRVNRALDVFQSLNAKWHFLAGLRLKAEILANCIAPDIIEINSLLEQSKSSINDLNSPLYKIEHYTVAARVNIKLGHHELANHELEIARDLCQRMGLEKGNARMMSIETLAGKAINTLNK